MSSIVDNEECVEVVTEQEEISSKEDDRPCYNDSDCGCDKCFSSNLEAALWATKVLKGEEE
jgi:hypothetical protein